MVENRSSDEITGNGASPGIIYVLTNPAMPGLVKIGKTSQSEVSARISQLYTTGVPLPFDCEYAVTVKDTLQAERALHFAFGPNRLNLNREFFEIDAEQAKVILDLIKIEDVTPGVEQNINALDISASDKFKNRRPRLNFGALDIPVGAVLEFASDREETATVANGKTRVNYRGDDLPISGLTATLLNWESNNVPYSGRYWKYEGKLLQEMYDELHGF